MRLLSLILISVFMSNCTDKNKISSFSCEKHLVYKNQYNDLYTIHYFVVDFLNNTQNNIRLTDDNFYIGNDSLPFTFTVGTKTLKSVIISTETISKTSWQIKKNENKKMIYFVQTKFNLDEEFIYIRNNNLIIDSIKIPNPIKLDEAMNIEEAFLEINVHSINK